MCRENKPASPFILHCLLSSHPWSPRFFLFFGIILSDQLVLPGAFEIALGLCKFSSPSKGSGAFCIHCLRPAFAYSLEIWGSVFRCCLTEYLNAKFSLIDLHECHSYSQHIWRKKKENLHQSSNSKRPSRMLSPHPHHSHSS